MARKPRRERKAPSPPPPRGTSDRDKAIDALMALLAEHGFEDIGLAEIAGRAGLKLSQLRAEFGSKLAIYAAHIKDIDRAVLAGGEDMTDEGPRERLFDVLMRRLEAMAPYKEAVRSMLRSTAGSPAPSAGTASSATSCAFPNASCAARAVTEGVIAMRKRRKRRKFFCRFATARRTDPGMTEELHRHAHRRP